MKVYIVIKREKKTEKSQIEAVYKLEKDAELHRGSIVCPMFRYEVLEMIVIE